MLNRTENPWKQKQKRSAQRNHGLVVKADYSQPRGRGFEFRCRILYGIAYVYIENKIDRSNWACESSTPIQLWSLFLNDIVIQFFTNNVLIKKHYNLQKLFLSDCFVLLKLFFFSGEAHQMGYLASGKLLKVGVEFSLEDPQGGIHFVVPEGKICDQHFTTYK